MLTKQWRSLVLESFHTGDKGNSDALVVGPQGIMFFPLCMHILLLPPQGSLFLCSLWIWADLNNLHDRGDVLETSFLRRPAASFWVHPAVRKPKQTTWRNYVARETLSQRWLFQPCQPRSHTWEQEASISSSQRTQQNECLQGTGSHCNLSTLRSWEIIKFLSWEVIILSYQLTKFKLLSLECLSCSNK